jgi:hypothetical protein
MTPLSPLSVARLHYSSFPSTFGRVFFTHSGISFFWTDFHLRQPRRLAVDSDFCSPGTDGMSLIDTMYFMLYAPAATA